MLAEAVHSLADTLNQVLLFIGIRHGAGKPTTKQIDEAADTFAFLVRNLGMTVKLPQ